MFLRNIGMSSDYAALHPMRPHSTHMMPLSLINCKTMLLEARKCLASRYVCIQIRCRLINPKVTKPVLTVL
jgi:hypothetical protein